MEWPVEGEDGGVEKSGLMYKKKSVIYDMKLLDQVLRITAACMKKKCKCKGYLLLWPGLLCVVVLVVMNGRLR